MFLDPNALAAEANLIENIEKASTRFVAQALDLFRGEALNIFAEASDLQADVGEDITTEALDSLGMSRMAQRSSEGWTSELGTFSSLIMLSDRYFLLTQKRRRPEASLAYKHPKLHCGFDRFGLIRSWMYPGAFRELQFLKASHS